MVWGSVLSLKSASTGESAVKFIMTGELVSDISSNVASIAVVTWRLGDLVRISVVLWCRGAVVKFSFLVSPAKRVEA